MCALSVRVELTGLARPEIANVALQSHMEGTLHAGLILYGTLLDVLYNSRMSAWTARRQYNLCTGTRAGNKRLIFCSPVMIVLCDGSQGANMNVMCSYWHLQGEANGCRRASGDAACGAQSDIVGTVGYFLRGAGGGVERRPEDDDVEGKVAPTNTLTYWRSHRV